MTAAIAALKEAPAETQSATDPKCSASNCTMRTSKLPQASYRFARVTFPEGWTMAAIRTTLDHFPETEGYRCDLREVGPLLGLRSSAGVLPAVDGEAVEVNPTGPAVPYGEDAVTTPTAPTGGGAGGHYR